MKNILVLCTGNSCRSQIAEGFLKEYTHERANVFSAGIETHGVNPKAIITMNEVGIDISNHTSNNILEYEKVDFDYILTVCDHANEKCPYFPSKAIKTHFNFPDPAKATGTEAEIQAEFGKVRDMISDFCKNWVDSLEL